ncbi:ATP-binding cassette domain-containing protein, partial [uncultured Parasutterella sp.]
MATLQIDSLSCAYKGKPVLNCVHAEFSSGRLTAILGRNGAGKTTLIRCIAGLHDYCGKVRLTDKEKVLDRSHIAYLPQLE